MKRWVVGRPDRAKAKAIAEECDIDAFAALIACGRGIDDPAELELMLSEEPLLCDPYELNDIKKAADRINNAISDGEKIAVFGDYDCDGVVATTVLYTYLCSRGANAVTYIPARIDEGYGMNRAAVKKLADGGVKLIVTVDNGISCAEEIEYAKTLGVETVVTDHHIPPETLPDAVAVVDPHRKDCAAAFKEVCGAVVAFKLVCVLDDKEPEQLLGDYCDLLAVATVGDVMPLINENRSIVRAGIRSIRKAPRTGIGAILSVAGIERNSVDAAKISFGIVPRINAASRMGDANRAFRLLCEKNMLPALDIAGQIDGDNSRRQEIEKSITAQACELIESYGYRYNRVIVASGEGWHSGIVGIVASRICEKYGKPAIILSCADGMAHGSGRSFAGFNLYNAINACGEHLEKYGGHELAAGVSLRADKIDDFRRAVNEYALSLPFAVPELKIDFRLNPLGMSVDMVHIIKMLEPYGAGNPYPVFGLFGVKLERITPVGSGKHLRLLFSKDGGAFQAMLFGVTSQQFCFCTEDTVDLAVTLDENFYKDEYTLSIRIKAIRKSGTDEEVLFTQIQAFDDYMSGFSENTEELLPTRAQVGSVYRYLSRASANADKIRYSFVNDIGYAKTGIAIKTLCELGLAKENNGIYSGVVSAKKTELLNSETYKAVSKGGKLL